MWRASKKDFGEEVFRCLGLKETGILYSVEKAPKADNPSVTDPVPPLIGSEEKPSWPPYRKNHKSQSSNPPTLCRRMRIVLPGNATRAG
jgi:hypothetical protein